MTTTYAFQPYDTLQLEIAGENQVGRWVDYATIRTELDASQAVAILRTGKCDGRPARFRIVRIGRGVKHILLES